MTDRLGASVASRSDPMMAIGSTVVAASILEGKAASKSAAVVGNGAAGAEASGSIFREIEKGEVEEEEEEGWGYG